MQGAGGGDLDRSVASLSLKGYVIDPFLRGLLSQAADEFRREIAAVVDGDGPIDPETLGRELARRAFRPNKPARKKARKRKGKR